MHRLFFVLTCVFLLLACEDDFELNAPYQDIPVVFAYLNPEAEDNFVRVQKAFFGTNGNAEVAAQNIDSVYYGENDATVFLSLGQGDPVALEQVNGEDFGIDREDGDFVDAPNLLYRIPSSFNLAGGQNVTLSVERPGETPATTSTTVLNPIDLRFPNNEMNIVLENYFNNYNIRWVVGNNAPRVYDIRFFLNIREFDTDNPGAAVDRRLEFVVAKDYEPSNADGPSVLYVFENERFWQFLGNNLEADPAIIRRFVDMEVQVTGVGQEIEDAISVSEANAGITSAQSIPVYTNVENGLGIFTSRVSQIEQGIILDPRNNDTLRNGIYTGDLNFQ